MFHHLVFWKFKEDFKQDLPEAVRLLRNMKESIPLIQELKAGLDVLHSARSWDLALAVTLPSQKDLEAYDQHPAHQPVKAWMKERAEASAAVDFDD
jgi:hypothetical protein